MVIGNKIKRINIYFIDKIKAKYVKIKGKRRELKSNNKTKI